jgi:hypothetical protein
MCCVLCGCGVYLLVVVGGLGLFCGFCLLVWVVVGVGSLGYCFVMDCGVCCVFRGRIWR